MKHITQDMYHCPFCNLAGWQRKGEFEAHLRKSHGRRMTADEARAEFWRKLEDMRKG